MTSNVVLVGWNRAIPGRERIAGEHFQEFTQYLGALKDNSTIDSFDAVLLNAHGGDLNGFVLIKGESSKLDTLTESADWMKHVTRGILHEEGFGVIRGFTGEQVMERMKLWMSLIPKE